MDNDVLRWTIDDVGRWLRINEMEDFTGKFQHLYYYHVLLITILMFLERFSSHGVDGKLLLLIDEAFLHTRLTIQNSLKRRRILKLVDELRQHQRQTQQDEAVDELDEYLLTLESRRIQLVAKLKTHFDRFDILKTGKLAGDQIEEMLKHMNRSLSHPKTKSWLENLNDSEKRLDFGEFVMQYSAIYSGEDPGQFLHLNNKLLLISFILYLAYVDVEANDDDRTSNKRNKSDFDDDYIRWHHGDDDEDHHGKDKKSKDTTHIDENGADILDLKLLAELKSIFDRFAVEGVITATEACQALTEAGVFAPRRFVILHCLWYLAHLFEFVITEKWYNTCEVESILE